MKKVALVVCILIIILASFVLSSVILGEKKRCGDGKNCCPIDKRIKRLGFVNVLDVVPDVLMDERYYTDFNFMGQKVPFYEKPICYMTKEAALALKRVQMHVKKNFGLKIKIYDCYRPSTSVHAFVDWSQSTVQGNHSDEVHDFFFPDFTDKMNLFLEGYIAEESGHSRGSTIDLTLVPLHEDEESVSSYIDTIYTKLDKQKMKRGSIAQCYSAERIRDNSIDMGTDFDCFSPFSHTENPIIMKNETYRTNRAILVESMKVFGFINYEYEWWHYTLENEPFPNTYFNFSVDSC